MSSSTDKPSSETRLAPYPLTICPECTYALAGLPIAHSCPECGLEYDEYSWAWPMPKSQWRNTRLLLGGTSIMGLMVLLFMLTRIEYDWLFTMDMSIIYMSVVYLYSLVYCVLHIRYVFQLRNRPFVAATPMGVTVRGVNKWVKHRTIPWANIVDVKTGTGWGRGFYGIMVAKGSNIVLESCIRNKEEWEVLKKALLAAKVHYHSSRPSIEK